ncbi:MAG: hypothetical protein KJ007_09345 [Burkholderiales bacterium]|nr:hypothetical protein [Burkholderiales bacterium]
MKSILVFALTLLTAVGLSFGQTPPPTFSVIPANPTTNDSIVVRVDIDICYIRAPNVTFVGTTAITIGVDFTVCPATGPSGVLLQVPIGKLPSGTYSVVLNAFGNLSNSTSFAVSGAPIPDGSGGLSIVPAQPNDTDYISIRFLGSGAIDSGAFPLACLHGDSAFRRVTVANNVIRIEKLAEEPIRIDIYTSLPPAVPSVPAYDVWSGRLVAGDYRVELYCSLYDTIRYASANFTVKPSYMTNVQRKNPLLNPPRPMASYSGQWTPETESGWGLFLNQVESRQLAVTLFLYAPDSRSVWYYCGGGQWESVFTYRTPCNKYVGTPFGLPFQGIQQAGSGTVVLRFAGPPVSGQPERLGVAASLENVVTVDLEAEGQQLTGKRFIRIR